MATETENNDEAQIRQLIDNWTKALHAKDVDALMVNYAPDVLLFDLAPPLQYKGADACRKNWEEWLPTFQGAPGCEQRELVVTVGNDIGFSHSLNRITGKRTDGTETDVGFVRPCATTKSMANGWSSTSMSQCLCIWMGASERQLICSRDHSGRQLI
jgi:ketosteroid isomerase-like protein